MCGSGWKSRLHHDLDARVVFVTKRAIHRRSLFQADPVDDDERRIDLPSFNPLEEQRHVFVHMGLAHLEGQPLGEGGTERKLVQPSAVDTTSIFSLPSQHTARIELS